MLPTLKMTVLPLRLQSESPKNADVNSFAQMLGRHKFDAGALWAVILMRVRCSSFVLCFCMANKPVA
ncbi:MAG TPA: hypothetical protein DCZ10_03975 [Pelotomaculum sp.]|nr:hypothetical protein [Pelotomaculum sp.]